MSGPSGPFGTTFGIRYKTVLSCLKSSVVESQAQEFSSSLRLRGWRPRRGRTLTIIGLPWSNICLSESSCTQCTEPTASSTVYRRTRRRLGTWRGASFRQTNIRPWQAKVRGCQGSWGTRKSSLILLWPNGDK